MYISRTYRVIQDGKQWRIDGHHPQAFGRILVTRLFFVVRWTGESPVDDSLSMQKFKGQHHLRGVKFRVLLQKQALLAEVEK